MSATTTDGLTAPSLQDAETTAPEQRADLPGRPFPKGVSGNPAGRPKGARHKLETAFIEALHDDFQRHGIEAIQRCRADKPEIYVGVIAKVLPKHGSIDLRMTKTHEEALGELE